MDRAYDCGVLPSIDGYINILLLFETGNYISNSSFELLKQIRLRKSKQTIPQHKG